MWKWLKSIFFKNKQYKEKIAELEQKLVEKQEHINKTNAFWKKKLYYSKNSNNR